MQLQAHEKSSASTWKMTDRKLPPSQILYELSTYGGEVLFLEYTHLHWFLMQEIELLPSLIKSLKTIFQQGRPQDFENFFVIFIPQCFYQNHEEKRHFRYKATQFFNIFFSKRTSPSIKLNTHLEKTSYEKLSSSP